MRYNVTALFVRLILIFALQNPTHAQTDTNAISFGNNKDAGNYITIDGANQYYEVYGQGDPLVLIHGNGGNIAYIKPQIEYFERMQAEYPEKSIEFVRCIAEGDLVALHTHQTWPGNDEYVTMDFFRFDTNGKICEHWDSIQQIPKNSDNHNTMY